MEESIENEDLLEFDKKKIEDEEVSKEMENNNNDKIEDEFESSFSLSSDENIEGQQSPNLLKIEENNIVKDNNEQRNLDITDITPEQRHTDSPKIRTSNQAIHNEAPNTNISERLSSDRSSISVILRGQARGEQLISSLKQSHKSINGLPMIKPTRNRIPPKLVRLATIYSSPARLQRVPKGPSLYYVDPKPPLKVIKWDEACNARPPLRVDMEGPSPWTYSPKNKPLNESNAPAYTFGTKCYPEKAGGSSTSWGKTWFHPVDPWHNKTDFTREGKWPTPNQYQKPSLLGPRQRTMPEAPAFTFGHKFQIIGVKTGTQTTPAPSAYTREKADGLILNKGPSFSHQFRREGTVLWCSGEINPGPAVYSPMMKHRLDHPSYTIQGLRREKSHTLGPFSSL